MSVLALTGLLAATLPMAPANADGAASTRNIILGGALAAGTLLIINHNKKVHQKEDELSNARYQAEAERDQANASASSMRHRLAAQNREMAALKRQVALQNTELRRLRGGQGQGAFIAPATANSQSVAYGWGRL